MSSVRVAMRWPAWLVAAVDEVAGPRGRSRFVVAAVQQALVSGNGKAPCAVVSPPEGLVSAAASPALVARERRIEAARKGRV